MLFIAIVCLAASTAGAICGIGGGVVIKPVLDAMNIASVAAVSFLSGCTVLAMSAYSVVTSFLKGGSGIRIRLSLPLSIGAVAGGIAGKWLFGRLSASFANPDSVGMVQAVCLFLLTAGTLLYTLKKSSIAKKQITSPAVCVGTGLALGIFSSFLGIGGGPFNLVVLSYCFSMDTKEAAQNSLFIILCSQLASLISSLVTGSVPDFRPVILILMAAMGILGAVIGRRINRRIESAAVDKLFILMIIVIMGICVYNFVKFLG